MIEQRDAFSEALDAHLTAISEREAERFARTLHPDVRLIGPSGTMIRGYEEALAAHRSWFSEPDWTFEPTIVWRQQEGNAAWALADVRYHAAEQKNRFLLFLLFVQQGGEWKLLYDQNTPLAPAR